MPELSLPARLYVAFVVLGASVLLGFAIVNRPGGRMDIVAILLLLHVVSESLLTRGSRDMASITLGSVTSLAAIPLVGMWGAAIAAWSAVFAHNPEGTPIVKRLFNGAQMSLSAGAAGAVYELLHQGELGLEASDFPQVLGPILAADIVHCAVNGVLVAIIVGLHNRVSPVVVFQGTMARSVMAYLAYGLFGVSLAVLWDGAEVGPAAAVLLLLPLFVARWAYAQYAEEQRAYDRTVRTLMAAVETKDVYTRGHSERVSAASVLVARTIGMREDRVASLRYAGMLHDIGKLGVPTRVLQKSGGLTDDEFAAIQRHPVQGLEIVREIEFLDEANAGIMHHHERLDGLGYPLGLRGAEIPEFARVIAVADAFDSMTTTRSYRGARSLEEAVVELRRCAGTQFDAALVEALVRGLDEHGWDPETVPAFSPPDATQVFDQNRQALDHDDPTSSLVEDPR
jgi:HD-GYP domain-containing protein (c-di-GMP phosphodiesterase class II)